MDIHMSIKKYKVMDKNRKKIERENAVLSASITVEASLVLFLFLIFFMSMMYFYQILNLEIKIQAALEETADAQSAYAAVSDYYDEKGTFSYIQCSLDQAFAKANVVRLVGKKYLDSSWIKGGSGGLSLLESSFLKDGETLQLVAAYQIEIPFFSIADIRIKQQAHRRIWYGEDTSGKSTKKNGSNSVYITENGSVYHLYADCDYIDVKLWAVTGAEVSKLRNADGSLYYPCESCKPDSAGTVYITTYGTRYHKLKQCKAIEKNPISVSKEEVSNRKLCSKCEKRQAS